jgi:hypothetical protein
MGMASSSNVGSKVARTVAGAGFLGIALIHAIDLPDKLEETPYIGVLYILLIAACVGLAALAALRWSNRLWALGTLVAASPLAGYVLTRTVGLPGARDDIGNWGEPLGIASIVVEVITLAVCVAAARSASRAASGDTSAGDGAMESKAVRV